MAAWQVKSHKIVIDAASGARGHSTRRRFFSYFAPVALILAGALSSCGIRGNLEPPPAVKAPSDAKAPSDTEVKTPSDADKEGAE